MLELIRNNVQSFFVKFIVIIIAVVMLFFGIDVFQQQGANVLVEVGDLEVTLEQYQRALDENRENVRKRFGAQASQVMNQMDLERQSLNRLINDALLVQSARANGIIATDLEVANSIRKSPYFQTDNRFDQSKYNDLLEQNKINSKTYEDNLRKEIVANKFVQLVMQGQSVSRKFIEDLFIRNKTTYETETLALDLARFSTPVTPSEAEIKKYYEENPSRFEEAKKYQINFFVLDAESDREGIKVRKREIEKTFERNKKAYQVKPQWNSRHILIATPQDGDETKTAAARALARKLAKQLQKNPKDFASLAKKHSTDPGSTNQGGNIGWMEEGRLAPAYQEAVENLKVGEVSDPVFTSFGFHVIQLLGTKVGKSRTLEQAKPEIIKEITEKKLERRLKNKAANAQKSLITKPFAEVAKAAGQTPEISKPFGATSQLEKIGFSFELYQSLEGLKANQKGVWTMRNGKKIVAYEISKIIPAQAKPFEAVKAEATRAVAFQMEKDQALEKMMTEAKKVKNQTDLNALSKTVKATPFKSSFTFNAKQIDQVHNAKEFVQATDKLNIGQATAISQGSTTFVTLLLKKTPGEGLDPRSLSQLEQRIKQEKAQIILMGLINDYKKTVEVKQNKKLSSSLNLAI
ncbi:MAG: SurA N-terminal domain-containing protein [SAR324 cluster bacterium]|nr:SurA N-terminal domain-containing protein [SAR324 cluster bacterium]